MFEYKNDLLVVDELIFDPAYPTNIIVRINDEYYMIHTAETRNRPIKELRLYKKTVHESWNKGTHDWQYMINGLIPRDGFKVPVGREITDNELAEIIEEYGLTEAEISQEFEDIIGSVYGDEYAKRIKSIQVKVSNDKAIPLEEELKAKGIQAGSVSPGRVNIRTGRGGHRPGAGRPSTGRRKRTLYITDEEYDKLKECIDDLRK